MGLTKSSSVSHLLSSEIQKLENACNYTIAIAGNPNVGKSTIFNHLTGMNQHTGNWPGKTVTNAAGTYEYKQDHFLLVDIPGTYSIMSNSEEEEIARNYICFGNPDITIVVLDATCIEKNLNLLYQIMEITNNIIVCVNLLDEAKKKKIQIDLKKLEKILGVPVIGTIAQKKKTLEDLKNCIYKISKKLEQEKQKNSKNTEKIGIFLPKRPLAISKISGEIEPVTASGIILPPYSSFSIAS